MKEKNARPPASTIRQPIEIEQSRRKWTTDEILEELRKKWRGETAILGTGRLTDDDKRERYGLLQIEGSRKPKMLWHGYLVPEQGQELRKAILAMGTVLDGRFDFMFATPWRIAWTVEAARIHVYDRKGLCCRADTDKIWARRLLGRGQTFNKDAAKCIRADGRAFHARTAVWLDLKDGDAKKLVTAWDLWNLLSDDPWEIYEAWTIEAAEAISKVTGVPLAQRDAEMTLRRLLVRGGISMPEDFDFPTLCRIARSQEGRIWGPKEVLNSKTGEMDAPHLTHDEIERRTSLQKALDLSYQFQLSKNEKYSLDNANRQIIVQAGEAAIDKK